MQAHTLISIPNKCIIKLSICGYVCQRNGTCYCHAQAFTLPTFSCNFSNYLHFTIFLFSALWGYIKLLIQVKGYQRKDVTVADVFVQNVVKHPNKPCILFEDQEWTFSQVPN